MGVFRRQSAVTMCFALLAMSCSAGNKNTGSQGQATGAPVPETSATASKEKPAAGIANNAPAATPAPGEIAEKWQTDFSVFASQIEKLRKAKGNEKTPDLSTGPTYKNKRIQWSLNFKALSRNGDKDSVDFDLEPFGIRYKFFSGTRLIMAGFQPAASALSEWQKIKAGAQVSFEGVCEQAILGTMTPGDGVPRVVAFVTVSSVTPIKVVEVAANGLSGNWKLFMRTNEWTVRLKPRSGLPGEYEGTAQRDEKDEKGNVVTMELGAALEKGKIRAWLGPGFVVCEAPFSTTKPMEGECKVVIGSGSTGPFRAERRQ